MLTPGCDQKWQSRDERTNLDCGRKTPLFLHASTPSAAKQSNTYDSHPPCSQSGDVSPQSMVPPASLPATSNHTRRCLAFGEELNPNYWISVTRPLTSIAISLAPAGTSLMVVFPPGQRTHTPVIGAPTVITCVALSCDQ